jgi:hypothetical protein
MRLGEPGLDDWTGVPAGPEKNRVFRRHGQIGRFGRSNDFPGGFERGGFPGGTRSVADMATPDGQWSVVSRLGGTRSVAEMAKPVIFCNMLWPNMFRLIHWAGFIEKPRPRTEPEKALRDKQHPILEFLPFSQMAQK